METDSPFDDPESIQNRSRCLDSEPCKEVMNMSGPKANMSGPKQQQTYREYKNETELMDMGASLIFMIFLHSYVGIKD